MIICVDLTCSSQNRIIDQSNQMEHQNHYSINQNVFKQKTKEFKFQFQESYKILYAKCEAISKQLQNFNHQLALLNQQFQLVQKKIMDQQTLIKIIAQKVYSIYLLLENVGTKQFDITSNSNYIQTIFLEMKKKQFISDQNLNKPQPINSYLSENNKGDTLELVSPFLIKQQSFSQELSPHNNKEINHNQSKQQLQLDGSPQRKKTNKEFNVRLEQITVEISDMDLFNYINSIKVNSKQDRIFGLIFGTFIGDALGATLEYQQNINSRLIEYCLTMPGGGPYQIAPGQVTDDSELAISLINGLVEITKNQDFDVENIANQYYNWFKSGPFDIGKTTQQALGAIDKMKNNQRKSNQMKAMSSENSQSNGCLMRIAPLAIFTALKNSPIDEVFRYALEDVSLTHKSKDVQIVIQVWVYTLHRLLIRDEKQSITEIYLDIRQFISGQEFNNTFVQKLFANFIDFDKSQNFTYNIRWVAISFVEGFLWLKKPLNYTFEDVMRSTLQKGGDTDTNACIVGSLVGAILGFKKMTSDNLVKQWAKKILSCKPLHNRQNYTPMKGLKALIKLMRMFS